MENREDNWLDNLDNIGTITFLYILCKDMGNETKEILLLLAMLLYTMFLGAIDGFFHLKIFTLDIFTKIFLTMPVVLGFFVWYRMQHKDAPPQSETSQPIPPPVLAPQPPLPVLDLNFLNESIEQIRNRRSSLDD